MEGSSHDYAHLEEYGNGICGIGLHHLDAEILSSNPA
jgi:hypothetical protein